ncbi:MAG: MFS transporter [Minisyncoccia bacterium]
MKNPVRLWYLYDFANSFASVVLIFYYPLLLSEKGASDTWIGVSASIATALLLIILPVLGRYSDRTGKRIYFIKIASWLMVLSLVAIAFLSQKTEVFTEATLFTLSVLYILFFTCFQGSYVFYSSMLREITDSDNSARVSGIGLGFGQLGNTMALSLIGPIMGSSFIFLGFHDKPLAFLLGAVLFALVSLPFLRQKEAQTNFPKINFSYKEFLKKIFAVRKVYLFIIGYALLSDAILTFQLYISLYMRNVFDFSDKLVTYVAVIGLVGTVLGGFFASKFSVKIKNEERALRIASLMYAVCFGLCALMPKITVLVFAVLFMSGVSYGLVFSLARAVYSKISPPESQGEFFSVFTVFERAASVIGPLVWIGTFYLFQKFGESIQYRGSILVLAVVCLLGFSFLRKSGKLPNSV